ncbi:MAG TPA: NAD(P)H-dependent oxidoreductase [Bacilli bacterium]
MDKMKIGIILGSTREGRLSPQVGDWVLGIAKERSDADFEIVDLRDYPLPFFGEQGNQEAIARWNQKLAEFDGFIFIVQEYNHSITGVLKNALDSARDAWANKAAGIVSYGSLGGARAAEHLRGILGELQIADVRTHPALSLFHDFENMSVFKPQAMQKDTVKQMLDQLLSWTKALKSIRK